MGIVNINDDSFSGDGSLDPEAALEQARAHRLRWSESLVARETGLQQQQSGGRS